MMSGGSGQAPLLLFKGRRVDSSFHPHVVAVEYRPQENVMALDMGILIE